MIDFIRRLERLEVRASKLFRPFIFYLPLNVKLLTHGYLLSVIRGPFTVRHMEMKA